MAEKKTKAKKTVGKTTATFGKTSKAAASKTVKAASSSKATMKSVAVKKKKK